MEDQVKKLEFVWWELWAVLGLSIGNLVIIGYFSQNYPLAGVLVAVNTVLMIMIYRHNKYVFLFVTVASCNPLLWVINGIYLKNRWNHPDANRDSAFKIKSKAMWWNLERGLRLVITAGIAWAFLAYYLQDRYEKDLSLVFVPVVGMLAFYFAYKHLVAPSEPN